MIYGHTRVSTDGQSIAAQTTALTAAGAGKVFREVASGAKTYRAQLKKAIAALEAGDVLMVTRLDRLARSTRDRLNVLAQVSERKAGLSLTGVRMSRHDDSARQADGDGSRRVGRI